MMRRSSSEFEFWQETLQADHHQLFGHYYTDNNGTAMNCDSPQLWKTSKSRREGPYLLPYDSRKSNLDGGKELMEMIRDMPESSYDLSFKDMVDVRDSTKESQETEHKKQGKLPKKAIPAQRNKKKRAGQICRTPSMESEVFLLKLFVSFGSSKKLPRQRKLSEFIPRPPPSSSDSRVREKQHGVRNWWKTMFVSVKPANKNRPKIERSTSDVSSNRTSLLERSSLPCQRSFSEKKWDCKGCLF